MPTFVPSNMVRGAKKTSQLLVALVLSCLVYITFYFLISITAGNGRLSKTSQFNHTWTATLCSQLAWNLNMKNHKN